jgi:hypothetical protein
MNVKSFLTLLTSVSVLLLLGYPTGLRAQFAFTTNADGSLNVSAYTNSPGTGGIVIIPDTTNGLPITSIGFHAFFLDTTITNVTMGTNIGSVGAGAFNGCSGLASVTMPDEVTNIGQNCFYGCRSLTNVTIPSRLTSIASGTFAVCTNLTSITLPNDVTYIGSQAFWGCINLTNVTIPFGVTNIDLGAFQSSAIATATIPGSVAIIGTNAFNDCGSLTSVTIPNSVVSLGLGAFEGCVSLTTVTIPNSVTSLGGMAFYQCTTLASVTVGIGVTNIVNGTFQNCTNLKSVYFKGNAPTIDVNSEQGAPAIAYYLPGTMGWGPMLGVFWPTVLWNPQAQSVNASFGAGTNLFGFTITGSSNLAIVVQAATSLTNPVWLSVSTNTLNTFVGTNGTSDFSDPQWTQYPARFYRFRSP